ncbi:MAG: SbcC/MukB-like Walker B domain-containing protein [Desulfobacterales bacterium]|nr:SbcC/MukB-like Walker B domain-containing protein [Desulfobacterales bacterium]MDD4393669.1 SbcC/MukB-like Walker B domain-containing protein [Desulfobacterales bacterium]
MARRNPEEMMSLLDFSSSDSEAGFRLKQLELYNWGTFHRNVWSIAPEGANSLLTGDIGSGKSTLVDAVVTLLVPHNKIVYNKAAGAETRERTLYSYIRGEYKSEKDDFTQAARAVSLRDGNSYTVLLARFANKGYAQLVTLAQVFWLKDQKKTPERFFVVADRALTIAEHFADFGSNILDLKKRLKKTAGIQVFDNFKAYGGRFRHLFGIASNQALDLFYQTVSMKSVGNLNEFVRSHMLEKSDVAIRIDELRRNFDNLNRAHGAVLRAKAQIIRLVPMEEVFGRYRSVEKKIRELKDCREALLAYVGFHKAKLLKIWIDELKLQLMKQGHRIEALEEETGKLQEKEVDLKVSISDKGGRRIEDIRKAVAELNRTRDRKLSMEKNYRTCSDVLGLGPARDEEAFYANRKSAETLLDKIEDDLLTLGKKQVDIGIEIKEKERRLTLLKEEIDSLKSRKNNIPLKNLRIRKEMAAASGIDEEQLPFAGELLSVREDEKAWEGAMERVLHNFGLSLLVPGEHYARVSHYVDRTRLAGRLVYFRTGDNEKKAPGNAPDADSLPAKLQIRPDTPFYGWLEGELPRRFDYACCDSIEAFRRLPSAITLNGQIKSGGRRHEKDDRHRIDDRSRYILGWTNQEKIRALETEAFQVEKEGGALADAVIDLLKEQQKLQGLRDAARDLLKVESYNEIHWQPQAGEIQVLEAERKRIEESSDLLNSLRKELEKVKQALTEKVKLLREQRDLKSRNEQKLGDRTEELKSASDAESELEEAEKQRLFPLIDDFRQETCGDSPFSLQNLDKRQRDIRGLIQQGLDRDEARIKRMEEKILKQMAAYKNDYPAETIEVDVSLGAMDAYGEMLRVLSAEDLPRHEARFKKLLNEGTINSIALFQNQLDKEKQEIQEKIGAINLSLRQTEYNPGTYIKLGTDPTQDVDVRNFQQEIRQCLANTLEGDELYSENKFLQVKGLIERFNGREGLTELDLRWTLKVTDVRNWFNFSASERWGEDDTEKEFYSDSAGKSGGQKEKLAYTILAAALAYQFGLEWGAKKSRSFRFVVIDEAFGKGSDESTRYGLELFKKLNLQLLIVTPLQKIHVIEDYIRAVHFIHNEGGKNSILRNLSIDEYRKEKARYLSEAAAGITIGAGH